MDEVKKNPMLVMLKENQSEEICNFISKNHPAYFKYFAKEYKNAYNCLLAVQYDSKNIQYIPPELQGPEIVNYCLKDNILNLRYIQNQTEEMCQSAVSLDARAFKFCKIQTELMVKHALKEDILNFQYINEIIREYVEIVLKTKNGLSYFFNNIYLNENLKKFTNNLSFNDEKLILKQSPSFIDYLNQNVSNCIMALEINKDNNPDLYSLIKIVQSENNKDCLELLKSKQEILQTIGE